MTKIEVENKLAAIKEYARIGDNATAHMLEFQLYKDFFTQAMNGNSLSKEEKDIAIAIERSKGISFERKFINN